MYFSCVSSSVQDETGSSGERQDNLVSQEHSLQLVENLRKIYYEEDCFLHDITLCSKDSGEVRAHKIVLAAQSQYFKVIIVNKFSEILQTTILC